MKPWLTSYFIASLVAFTILGGCSKVSKTEGQKQLDAFHAAVKVGAKEFYVRGTLDELKLDYSINEQEAQRDNSNSSPKELKLDPSSDKQNRVIDGIIRNVRKDFLTRTDVKFTVIFNTENEVVKVAESEVYTGP